MKHAYVMIKSTSVYSQESGKEVMAVALLMDRDTKKLVDPLVLVAFMSLRKDVYAVPIKMEPFEEGYLRVSAVLLLNARGWEVKKADVPNGFNLICAARLAKSMGWVV